MDWYPDFAAATCVPLPATVGTPSPGNYPEGLELHTNRQKRCQQVDKKRVSSPFDQEGYILLSPAFSIYMQKSHVLGNTDGESRRERKRKGAIPDEKPNYESLS